MHKYIKLARPKEASPVHRQRGSLPHAQEICLTDMSSYGSSQKSLRSNNDHINTNRIQSLAAWEHAQCFQNEEEENFKLSRHPKVIGYLKVEVVSVVGQGVLEEQLGGEGVASWALRSGKDLSGLLAECQLENPGKLGALKFLRVLGWVWREEMVRSTLAL